MDNLLAFLKEKIKDPRWLAGLCAAAGLLVGLLFGWVLFPVQWTDASAENLRPDLRLDYLRNAITTYTLTGDQIKAQQLYNEMGKEADATFEELRQNPGFLNSEQIERFAAAINAAPAEATPTAQAQLTPTAPDAAAVEPESPDKSNGLLTLGLILAVLLIAGAYLVYRFYFRERSAGSPEPLPEVPFNRAAAQTPVRQQPMASARQAGGPMAVPVESTRGPEGGVVYGNGPVPAKPVAQFMTAYSFGDDLYDESFTFDAPNGEFLGECGVSISELIGVGEPKKICAFDVWLFDKNDIQTVTKVVMSRHAMNTPEIRQRLELHGEPVLAEPGKQIFLETATLRLEARIGDVIYGDLPLPEDSYFKRCTIELAVYRR